MIFPAKQGISVDASFDKTVYKPNDEATIKFGILDVAGRAVESALGVVIFDKAVEERAGRMPSSAECFATSAAGWAMATVSGR